MKPVFVITGATGCGKSGIIEKLDLSIPIEIINADSRQVYKGMKIGTALPTEEEMQRFPHHLFSFLDPDKTYSAGEFVKSVSELIPEIHKRNHIPVIVGGTFFYIKALWDGLASSPPEDPGLAAEIEKKSLEECYRKLSEIDPQRAGQISPNDKYRVRKSLLQCLSLGHPVSSLKKSGGLFDSYNFDSFWLDVDRKELYERINKRVEKMFSEGLLNEFETLIKAGYTENSPGLKTIGYREIFQIASETGYPPEKWTIDIRQKAVELIQLETRHFAKRQLTWFRNENRLKRIDPLYAVSLLSGRLLREK